MTPASPEPVSWHAVTRDLNSYRIMSDIDLSPTIRPVPIKPPRDQAIDAVPTRPRENKPDENHHVQNLREVQEVIEPGEYAARLDALDPIGRDRDDHDDRER